MQRILSLDVSYEVEEDLLALLDVVEDPEGCGESGSLVSTASSISINESEIFLA